MPQGATLRVHDLEKLLVLISKADRATSRALRDEIRQAGGAVRTDAALKFAKYSEKSAAGYRVIVRRRGVAVEQRYRRTTGKRPDFGKLQMRKALVPALEENTAETMRGLNEAFDRIAARFNDA